VGANCCEAANRGENLEITTYQPPENRNLNQDDETPAKKARANADIMILNENISERKWKIYDNNIRVTSRIKEILNDIDSKIREKSRIIEENEFNSMNNNDKVSHLHSIIDRITKKAEENSRFLLCFYRPPVQLQDWQLYKGQWNIKGGREGYGIIKYPDSSLYEGFIANNLKTIRGIFIDHKCNYYSGDFSEDKAQNYGVYVSSDGNKYSGYWVNDYQEGEGTEYYADTKATYVGLFVKGEKHGEGTLELADKTKYKGAFKNNNIEGHGIFTWPDGREYNGNWKDNKMNGHGIYSWLDGRKYEGEYKNDIKEGKGKYYWNETHYYDGEFKKMGKDMVMAFYLTMERF